MIAADAGQRRDRRASSATAGCSPIATLPLLGLPWALSLGRRVDRTPSPRRRAADDDSEARPAHRPPHPAAGAAADRRALRRDDGGRRADDLRAAARPRRRLGGGRAVRHGAWSPRWRAGGSGCSPTGTAPSGSSPRCCWPAAAGLVVCVVAITARPAAGCCCWAPWSSGAALRRAAEPHPRDRLRPGARRPAIPTASAVWNIGFDAGTATGSVVVGALAAAYSFGVGVLGDGRRRARRTGGSPVAATSLSHGALTSTRAAAPRRAQVYPH